MFDAIYNFMMVVANWFWGMPVLVILIGGGLYLTVCTDFVQFKHFGTAMKLTVGKTFGKNAEKGEGISGWQTVCAALSGTIGTGNIVGVGTAIAMGGPGAVLWMEITGLVAMCIKSCEAMTSVKYRMTLPNGGYHGGPYYMIRDGLGSKPLAWLYNIGLIPSLVIAAGVHTGSTVSAAEQMGLPGMPVFICAAVIVALVCWGGVTMLVNITDKLVPFMSALYILGGTVVILLNIGNLPNVIVQIFTGAFSGTAAVGGFAGATVSACMRYGLARGMYSNDAGNGIAGIIHAQSNAKDPVEQGLWGVFEVFMDTTIVCTFTALVILSTGQWQTGEPGSTLAINSFAAGLGPIGLYIAGCSLMLFAMSTAMSFSTFVGLQIEHQTGSRLARRVIEVLYIATMYAGAYMGIDKIIATTDFTNAILMLVNMPALCILGRSIGKDYKAFFAKVEKK